MVHLDSLLYHTFTSYIHVRGVKCLREERGKHEIPVCRGVARLNIVSPEERRGVLVSSGHSITETVSPRLSVSTCCSVRPVRESQ